MSASNNPAVEPVQPAVEPVPTPTGFLGGTRDAGEQMGTLFSVTSGNPTPEELAALAAVVVASMGTAAPAAPAKPSVRHWVRRQQLRLEPTPGPGAWRRSRG